MDGCFFLILSGIWPVLSLWGYVEDCEFGLTAHEEHKFFVAIISRVSIGSFFCGFRFSIGCKILMVFITESNGKTIG